MSDSALVPNPDRPEIEVRVAGSPVDPEVQRDVVEVDVSEEVNRHGRLSLLVQNWDPDTRTVRYSDDGPFAPGVVIEVRLGYHSDLTSVFEGVVTAVVAHFDTSRAPTLQVEARSRSILLDDPPRSRVFEEVQDGDIVRAIASDYALEVNADDGIERSAVVLDREDDWGYLTRRAAELGWVTYVRGTTLTARPPAQDAEGALELQWTGNLVEVRLREDLAGVGDPTSVSAWDPETLEAVRADADAGRSGVDTGDRPDHGRALEDAGWPLRERLEASTLAWPSDEADGRAAGMARTAALRQISGTALVIGVPALRCDSWVRIGGVGGRFSGPHYLSAVRHRLSSRGFVSELQLGSPPRLLPPPSAGARQGLSLGVVEDLDDPQGWGRVKVRMPWREGGSEAVWSRLATLDAGPEQGTFFVPDPGQEVVVGYADEDRAAPIVLGSLWNGKQKPPIAIDPDANNVRSLTSRSGHVVSFDDGDDAAVRITTAGGHRLVLSDKDGSVTLTEAGAGSGVTLSGDGIAITAKKGDVSISATSGKVLIDAMGIEGTSKGPAKLESSATLDVKAAATLGLKGALVNIN